MKRLPNAALALAALCLLAADPQDPSSESEPATSSHFIAIDLQPHANQELSADFHGYPGNNLKQLARGRQRTCGVEFVIGEKFIQLASKRAPDWPEQVKGIDVGREVNKLHFLHGTGWGYPQVTDGTPIGSFVVHFKDGSREVIPIEYGRDVRDWWALGDTAPVTRGEIAWNGVNEASQDFRGQRVNIRLFKATWENPYPGEEITSIDYSSRNETISAPFLIAITAEGFTEEAIAEEPREEATVGPTGDEKMLEEVATLQESEAIEALKELGAFLEYGETGRVTVVSLAGPGPRRAVSRGTDAAVRLLADLPTLETVHLDNSNITDAGLMPLSALAKLRSLSLNLTGVTDAGLAHLKDLKSLERLHIYQTRVTDEGLRHIAGLENLKVLDISRTRVTDKGLRHLENLASLESLDMRSTQVTEAGAEQLKQKLPGVRILYGAK